jgi:acetylxylan esterase
MRRLLAAIAAATVGVAAVAATLTLTHPASAAGLTEVTNFGYNPTNIRMYEYLPATAPAHPAVLVANHWCGGSGPDMFSGSEFASLADQYGFLVIYPSVTRDSKCWDVASDGALTHNGNSDPAGIMSMVQWEIRNRAAAANRVYVTGISSGAMLTNVLLGDYPDVFQSGAAFMGVPFYCFFTGTVGGWNNDCSQGLITKTPQQWGDLVRAAFPGYTGRRPRMQLWHGTADAALNYHNLGEEIKQWTDVLGVSQTPSFTDHPSSVWTRTRYGGTGTMAPVEANSFDGFAHDLPRSGMSLMALQFMGLVGAATPPSSAPPSAPPTSPSPSTGTGTCRVTATVSAWNTGLTESITITNTTTVNINSWSLVFTLPGGQTITNGWNASYAPSSGQVTATNAGYNGTLAAGASTTIGFQASHTGNTAASTGFSLNGGRCTTS